MRALTDISLQKISQILLDDNFWAYSIALDANSKRRDAFIDVRCRLFNGTIQNIHFLAISLCGKRTGENIFNVVYRFLESVAGNIGPKNSLVFLQMLLQL